MRNLKGCFIGLVSVFFLMFLPCHFTHADVPQLINYQGYLTDSGGFPLDGNYSILFFIYDVPSGGTALWSETQVVNVVEGNYSVQLGHSTSFPLGFFNGNLYLAVKVGTDDEMEPRLPITSVAFAMKAEDAETLEGYGASYFITAEQPNSITSAMIVDGSVGAGKIATNAIGTSEIQDNSITAGDLAVNSVGANEIATGAVGSEEIANGSVTVSDLQDGAALAEILDNDGAGSGLDADFLDGFSSSAFVKTTGGTMIGALEVPYLKTDGSTVFKYDSVRSNVLVGKSAGIGNTTGINNTFLGPGAGEQHQSGNNNIFLGQGAGQDHKSGQYNSFLGPWSGKANQTGSYNVFIGANAGYNEAGSYKLYIDDTSTNQPLVYGEFDNDLLEVNGRFNVTGELCVGQKNAGSKLHVVESAQSLTYPLKVDNPDLLSSVGILFSVEGNGGSYAPERGKGGLVYEKRGTWNRGDFHFLQDPGTNSDNPDLDDAVMSITNNGNVGIGTKYPGTRLEVADLTRITNYSWPIAGEGLELGYNPAEDRGYIQAYDRGSGDWGELYLGHGRVGIGAESLDEGFLPYTKLRVAAHANPHYYAIGCKNTIYGTEAFLGGPSAVEAWGDSDSRAGYFSGDVRVSGYLDKSGGGFKIDHPLEPENKYLNHSFVESPDMMNVYNGNVVLDAFGEAWVEMPEWFETLNRGFRYQLTPIGAPAPNLHIAKEMEGNRFKIGGGATGLKVSWQVTGIRQDPWANANRPAVEEDKTDTEIGHYLHPELHGQPEEKGIEWARDSERMERIKKEREKQ